MIVPKVRLIDLGIKNLKKEQALHLRATKSAISAVGFYLQKEIQRQGRLGSNSGSYLNWPKLNPHTGILSKRRGRYGKLQAVKNYRLRWKGKKGEKTRVKSYRESWLSSRANPFSRAVSLARYQKASTGLSVRIGFLKPGIMKLMQKQAEGWTTPVSSSSRKMFFALGFPLKKETRELRVPGRPWVEVIFRHEQPKLPALFEQKYSGAIQRYRANMKEAA